MAQVVDALDTDECIEHGVTPATREMLCCDKPDAFGCCHWEGNRVDEHDIHGQGHILAPFADFRRCHCRHLRPNRTRFACCFALQASKDRPEWVLCVGCIFTSDWVVQEEIVVDDAQEISE